MGVGGTVPRPRFIDGEPDAQGDKWLKWGWNPSGLWSAGTMDALSTPALSCTSSKGLLGP